MEKKYKVLKKFGDLKKGDEFIPENETEEEIAEAITDGFIKEISDKKEITKIIFKVRNEEDRIFDEKSNGENWKESADSFGEAEKNQIVNRIEE